MAVIKPFPGLRPVSGLAAKVASLPYDVMDSDEARQVVRQNPDSFLRVTKSEVDLPPEIDIHSCQVYQKAKANLLDFTARGILQQDENPCFYIYRQQMGDHVQIGLVAAASVDEYQTNRIKKHELTRPDKENDRVEHILATEAQTGSVFLAYREEAIINQLVGECITKRPDYDFTADDGIRHTLYVVDCPDMVRRIEAAFLTVDALYIADGHHRSAAAARVRELYRGKNPNHTGDEAYNRFLAVLFPHTSLRIMDYNRVVRDLAGLTAGEFLRQVEKYFMVESWNSGACKPEQPRQFGMYLAGAWHRLTAKPDTYDAVNPVLKLDVSILQNNLLSPLLKISDPRTDQRIGFVGGIRGMRELERLVDSGGYEVAFSLYPTSLDELMAIADAGEIMPPKSTWFEPKLRDAMAIHLVPCPK